MNVEKELKKLEDESKAMKAAFERSAAQIPIFTKTVRHSTSQNRITLKYPGGGTSYNGDPESVIVTFNTNSGINTLAKLEATTDNSRLPLVRRVPFSGGARWSVTANPKGDFDGNNWSPTNYTFTVQAASEGTLTTEDGVS